MRRELEEVKSTAEQQGVQVRELRERLDSKNTDCEDLERGLAEVKYMLTTELQHNHRHSADTARVIEDLTRNNKRLTEDLHRSESQRPLLQRQI